MKSFGEARKAHQTKCELQHKYVFYRFYLCDCFKQTNVMKFHTNMLSLNFIIYSAVQLVVRYKCLNHSRFGGKVHRYNLSGEIGMRCVACERTISRTDERIDELNEATTTQ